MPSFAARAPRCTIANVDTGESIACLFNARRVVRPEETEAGAGALMALEDVWTRVQARAEAVLRAAAR